MLSHSRGIRAMRQEDNELELQAHQCQGVDRRWQIKRTQDSKHKLNIRTCPRVRNKLEKADSETTLLHDLKVAKNPQLYWP